MNRTSLQQLSIKISSGLTPLRSNEEFWNSPDIPWIKTEQLGQKNIYDSNEKISQKALDNTGLKLYPKNTLSVAMYGEGKTRGSVSILKGEMTTNQACCNIELDKNKADYEYVYYYLTTQYNQLRNLSSGVRKNLNSNDIKNFEIRIPEKLEEQLKIASVLTTLDAKIELNNRINAELEAMAKTLYDYWFVQFDFPNKDGKPYKSSGGEMVYNKELKREIPEGWEVKNFDSIANITTGKLDSNAEVIGGQYPFYTCSAEPTTIDNYAYDDSVILVAGNNARGNFHVNRYKGKFNAYQRTYIITVKEKKFFEYMYQIIKLETALLKKKGQGSQTKFITLGMLTDIKIFDSKNPVYDKFFDKVKDIFLMQMNVQKQNLQLASLRDWLLPMLMNGQVTVKEVEEKVSGLSMVAEAGVEYKTN